MQLTEHFTLSEFFYSSTARVNHIDNTPPQCDEPLIICNLTQLCVHCLEPIRKLAGHPIMVTSGYRTPQLNRKVGGVVTSQHLKGQAADFFCPELLGHAFFNLFMWISEEVDYDQLIYYQDKGFIHISYRSAAENRHCAFIKRTGKWLDVEVSDQKRIK